MHTFTYGELLFTVTQTQGGLWRTDIVSPPPPPLVNTPTFRFYYRKELTPEGLLAWQRTRRGQRVLTCRVGQLLVATYREALREGLISRHAAAQVAQAASARYPGGVYASRPWQDYAARELFQLTGLLEHYLTDAWL
jgi:hypothetical protein